MAVDIVPPSDADQRELVAGWFETFHAPIYRYLLRLIGEPESAADLLQDTFTRAFAALAHQAPPENVSAWLYRIASNLAYNTLRRRRRLRWLPLLGTERAPAFEDEVVQVQSVRACLAQLKASDAEAILLHMYAGLTSSEIGVLTGERATTIRMRLSRAYARFEQLYEKERM